MNSTLDTSFYNPKIFEQEEEDKNPCRMRDNIASNLLAVLNTQKPTSHLLMKILQYNIEGQVELCIWVSKIELAFKV